MSRGKRDGQRDHAHVNAHANAPTDAPAAPREYATERATSAGDDAEAQALSAFFRELATRAERDPAFGAGLLSVAQASGLARLTGADGDAADAEAAASSAGATTATTATTPPPAGASVASAPTPTPSAPPAQSRGKRGRQPGAKASGLAATPPPPTSQTPPDPFAVMRAQGEVGLRATLDALDLDALRQIVRAHRLDPARISARWANRDRVIALIVDQTRARLNHGRAFERV